MGVHCVFIARSKNVFNDAHIGVFQDDLVVVGSDFHNVLGAANSCKGE